jgi:hypothetical protein
MRAWFYKHAAPAVLGAIGHVGISVVCFSGSEVNGTIWRDLACFVMGIGRASGIGGVEGFIFWSWMGGADWPPASFLELFFNRTSFVSGAGGPGNRQARGLPVRPRHAASCSLRTLFIQVEAILALWGWRA